MNKGKYLHLECNLRKVYVLGGGYWKECFLGIDIKLTINEPYPKWYSKCALNLGWLCVRLAFKKNLYFNNSLDLVIYG